LFPEDRPLPDDAVDSIQVRLSGLELRRPRRSATAGWRVSCGTIGTDGVLARALPEGSEAVSWRRCLRLLVVNRLLATGERGFACIGTGSCESAMDALLRRDFQVAEKDRLYRCLDRVLEHKQELFVWLKHEMGRVVRADFEVLLYDLTSTYFEGEMEENPKAKRGYSRDSRPDCLQVVIALVVTPDGFPLGVRSDGRQPQRAQRRCGRFWITSRRPTQCAPGVGDGSRDSDGSHAGRDARAGPGDLLPGGYAQGPHQQAREEMAGSAVAASPPSRCR